MAIDKVLYKNAINLVRTSIENNLFGKVYIDLLSRIVTVSK